MLRHALTVVQCTECGEETSCLTCLRNYGNQIYWEELRRGQVARLLLAILADTFPEELRVGEYGVARVAAIDKPRWLAQQLMSTAQEAFLAVSSITRERPQGETKSWVEMLQELLRAGKRVSLLVADLPPANRTEVINLGLREHLRLLVGQYGLDLAVTDLSLPDWHIVIDPRGTACQAIQIEHVPAILNSRTGTNGLVTVINPEAVRSIATSIEDRPRRTVTARDLEPPPNTTILHIQQGEPISEAQLFGRVFSEPLSKLEINDRYLRSDHHEDRLRAYLSLVTNPPQHQTEVVVTTFPASTFPNPRQYQSVQDQHQMFRRLARDFPLLDVKPLIQDDVPHDRFLLLTRPDGSRARIGIGAGLDFIRQNGRARMTDISIEDPYV